MDGIMQVGHLKPDTKGQLRWSYAPNQGFARIAWVGMTSSIEKFTT
jgi:hypothetical protein